MLHCMHDHSITSCAYVEVSYGLFPCLSNSINQLKSKLFYETVLFLSSDFYAAATVKLVFAA